MPTSRRIRKNPDGGQYPVTPDDKSDAAAIKRRGSGRKTGDLTYNDLMDEIERLERKIAADQ